MIRCIYLLSIDDRQRRSKLIEASVKCGEWKDVNNNKRITDKKMVELANRLQGWTQNVYKFGCGFIHLSSFHDYRERDPMDMISSDEKIAIADYMHGYHGVPKSSQLSFSTIVPYLPAVFKKIADNLECYVEDLERDGDLSED
jgi:hypothetical protein